MVACTEACIVALNREITAKFETHARLMKNRGFEGRSFGRSIGTGQAKLRIGDGVGEIDYLDTAEPRCSSWSSVLARGFRAEGLLQRPLRFRG